MKDIAHIGGSKLSVLVLVDNTMRTLLSKYIAKQMIAWKGEKRRRLLKVYNYTSV